MNDNELDALRLQIDDIDRKVLELIKKRSDVASEIGRVKVAQGLPVRNYKREKECIENARMIARDLGLSPSIAEEVQLRLIKASLTTQEQDRVRQRSEQVARRAAIIGGGGKMGNWFAHFLSSQGFDVDVLDPFQPNDVFGRLERLEDVSDHDVVVVAAPLLVSNRILIALSGLRPRGLVFDVASLKGPLREGLAAVATAQMQATSIHPMFGPDTQLLSGSHVILVDLGNKEANQAAKSLFAPTMATLVEMDAEDHDRSMAFLLGLSHAVNLVFAKILAESGESAPRLMELSSTTFNAQLSIASKVVKENPKLYFEIQALNPYGDLSLAMLESVTESLRNIVKDQDEKRFALFMQDGYNYLQHSSFALGAQA